MSLFTSESVGEGHPDKLCDQVSDAVLDAYLAVDPHARVACETATKTGRLWLFGEISSSNADVLGTLEKVARDTAKDIGYTSEASGLDANTCAVEVHIHGQAHDIAVGVNEGDGLHKEQGAGDQGMMFGYACDETPALMPAPIYYSHLLTAQQAKLRHAGEADWMGPDCKSQVTVEYDGDAVKRIHTVVFSTLHTKETSEEQVDAFVKENVIRASLPGELIDDKTIFHVNPTGAFTEGGPAADAGLTGRKIIVDTYGGMGAHGGGAFSGKDPSKVDRSAAYFSRYIAKNIVKAGLAKRCQLQLAYAIGVAEPVSIRVQTFGTSSVAEEKIEEALRANVSFTPKSIIESLDLLRPIYRQTAKNGHFGHDGDSFPWEKTDLAERLLGFVS